MTDFNTRIIEEFRANDGYVGAPFNSDRLILVHHVGAKSGEARIAPLMSFPDPAGWIVVASKGGAPENPAWFYNLQANPETVIEAGTETVPVTASVVGPDERDALWETVKKLNPAFAQYETQTDRTIPLVRLARRA